MRLFTRHGISNVTQSQRLSREPQMKDTSKPTHSGILAREWLSLKRCVFGFGGHFAMELCALWCDSVCVRKGDGHFLSASEKTTNQLSRSV